MSFRPPELIKAEHDVRDFSCGYESLDAFLRRFALTNVAAGIARTYVTTLPGDKRVVGYYSLAAASVEQAKAPERVTKGTPRSPIFAVLLGRLAVDKRHPQKGLGKALLKDALLRSVSAADSIGVRVVLVHAKDEQAAAFYMKFDFVPSPTDPLHLMLLIEDIKAAFRGPRN